MSELEKTLETLLTEELSVEETNINHIEYLRFLRKNPNNFSYWFPKIRSLRSDFIKIPKSYIIDISDTLYKSFFLESEKDRPNILAWVVYYEFTVSGRLAHFL